MAEQLALVNHALMEKDRLLSFFESNHPQYIESLRAFAIAKCRYAGTISIDDLRELIAEKNYPLPREIGADDRLLGVVLSRCKEFECVGTVLSRRAETVARSGKNRSMISVYRLRQRGAA